MKVLGYGTVAAEPNVVSAYRGERQTKAAFDSARIVALRAKLTEFCLASMMGLGVVLTLAWTGLVVGALYWGLAQLI
jgi:hypothetical protein